MCVCVREREREREREAEREVLHLSAREREREETHRFAGTRWTLDERKWLLQNCPHCLRLRFIQRRESADGDLLGDGDTQKLGLDVMPQQTMV